MTSDGSRRRQACVGYVRVHAQQFCVQRERDASGKRAAPAHGAHARVVGGGGGRPRTGTPSFKIGCKPPPAMAADGETITRDAVPYRALMRQNASEHEACRGTEKSAERLSKLVSNLQRDCLSGKS